MLFEVVPGLSLLLLKNAGLLNQRSTALRQKRKRMMLLEKKVGTMGRKLVKEMMMLSLKIKMKQKTDRNLLLLLLLLKKRPNITSWSFIKEMLQLSMVKRRTQTITKLRIQKKKLLMIITLMLLLMKKRENMTT
jgi:hypothetical protein